MEWMIVGACLWTLASGPICNATPVPEEAAYVCDVNGCFDRGIVGGPGRYTYPGYRDEAWRYSGPQYRDDDYYRFRHGLVPGVPGYRGPGYGVERRHERRQYRRYDRRDGEW